VDTAPAPYPDGSYAIVCAGDSITAGSTEDDANGIAEGTPGLVTGNGYRKYLLDDLRIRNECPTVRMFGSQRSGTAGLLHEGHPGWTVNQVAGVLGKGLAPQFVVLLAGVNDLGQGRTWSQVIDDTGSLVGSLLGWAPWVRVVVCEQVLASGLYNHDRTATSRAQQAINNALPTVVDDPGRVVIARTGAVANSMVDNVSSGVHPLDVGYRWMAYAIYHSLRPWLGHQVGPKRWMTNIPVPAGTPRPLWMLP
jgi:lysophospholipase L1-like esterase